VWIECKHNCRSAYRLGSLEQSLHDGHVAAVDTVEVANRNGAAAR
jgi:hypothetical protein